MKKKYIFILALLLLVSGCSSKTKTITLHLDKFSFLDGTRRKDVTVENGNIVGATPSLSSEATPYFIEWKDEKNNSVELNNIPKNARTLVAVWDEEKIAEKKQETVSKEETNQEEKDKSDDEARKKSEEKYELVDKYSKEIEEKLNADMGDFSNFKVKRKVMQGKNLISIEIDITSQEIINNFTDNITSGKYKREVASFLDALKILELSIVKGNPTDHNIFVTILNPANKKNVLYGSLDGVTLDSYFVTN
ncbi:hypothetical protein H9L01_05435 [Erysipelothrix inopinata]|uniref:DUF5067 domain-containing protein n=1 Tax=Erysipelothrix inopinata TaxID=225084 RepID=A0A7G9RW60_9FIRM|nr:hypothetical protein [Erysipelothrix inopinata]QNN59835.1 hypothetical protein H9L01_05435 [Erysipelothrix inopinata]